MMAPGPGDAEDTFPAEEDDVSSDTDEFDIAGPEFRSINAAMDQLQLALDRLESHNAGIHEELLELLQSNREIRMAFKQESGEECDGNDSEEKEAHGDYDQYNAAGSNNEDSSAGASNLAKSFQNNLTSESGLASLKLEDKVDGTD